MAKHQIFHCVRRRPTEQWLMMRKKMTSNFLHTSDTLEVHTLAEQPSYYNDQANNFQIDPGIITKSLMKVRKKSDDENEENSVVLPKLDFNKKDVKMASEKESDIDSREWNSKSIFGNRDITSDEASGTISTNQNPSFSYMSNDENGASLCKPRHVSEKEFNHLNQSEGHVDQNVKNDDGSSNFIQ